MEIVSPTAVAADTSARRLAAALRHERPDRIPIDLGSTAVTGVHVTCVAALRDYYGLEKRPVKVHEPYQMLGWIDGDLAEVLGVDTAGVFSRETCSASRMKTGGSGIFAASTSWCRGSSTSSKRRTGTS
ncbi:MAG TPA: hypothetical protein VFQ79_12980 [Bryobacteraceae bacterium]|nr:hypothetical protein [Bryobacteraceae bacterium]